MAALPWHRPKTVGRRRHKSLMMGRPLSKFLVVAARDAQLRSKRLAVSRWHCRPLYASPDHQSDNDEREIMRQPKGGEHNQQDDLHRVHEHPPASDDCARIGWRRQLIDEAREPAFTHASLLLPLMAFLFTCHPERGLRSGAAN